MPLEALAWPLVRPESWPGAGAAAEGTAAVVGGTAAVGAGTAAAAGGGGVMAALPPLAAAAALVAGTIYADKKLGLTDRMAAWEKKHDPLVRWYEQWKGGGESKPEDRSVLSGEGAPQPPGLEGGAPGAVPPPGAQYAAPLADSGAMQGLMAMLEAHWVSFTKMWADGIVVKGLGQMAAMAGEAPAAAGPSLPAEIYHDLKAAGKAVSHGIGTAAQWTGEKLGQLGKYGKGGLDAFRKGGLQAMVEQFEGWRDKEYDDVGGKGTIGYGHLVTAKDRASGAFAGGRLSKEQGHALSQQDVAKARETVLRQTKGVSLNENQLDALTDFVYGIGSLVTKDKSGKMTDRTILKDLKAGNFDQVQKDFMMYSNYHDKAGNLKQSQPLYDRHLAESMLFGGQAGGQEVAGNTLNQKTTIVVQGVQEPAAVAARLKSEQGRVNNEAMRNLSPRTA